MYTDDILTFVLSTIGKGRILIMDPTEALVRV